MSVTLDRPSRWWTVATPIDQLKQAWRRSKTQICWFQKKSKFDRYRYITLNSPQIWGQMWAWQRQNQGLSHLPLHAAWCTTTSLSSISHYVIYQSITLNKSSPCRSLCIWLSLQTLDQSFPPYTLLAPLHNRFYGSLNLALFSFHITIIITVYHSYHLISSAIRPTIVQCCLRISLHRVFTIAWLAAGTLNLLTHLSYYYLISSPHVPLSFHFIRKS